MISIDQIMEINDIPVYNLDELNQYALDNGGLPVDVYDILPGALSMVQTRESFYMTEKKVMQLAEKIYDGGLERLMDTRGYRAFSGKHSQKYIAVQPFEEALRNTIFSGRKINHGALRSFSVRNLDMEAIRRSSSGTCGS